MFVFVCVGEASINSRNQNIFRSLLLFADVVNISSLCQYSELIRWGISLSPFTLNKILTHTHTLSFSLNPSGLLASLSVSQTISLYLSLFPSLSAPDLDPWFDIPRWKLMMLLSCFMFGLTAAPARIIVSVFTWLFWWKKFNANFRWHSFSWARSHLKLSPSSRCLTSASAKTATTTLSWIVLANYLKE